MHQTDLASPEDDASSASSPRRRTWRRWLVVGAGACMAVLSLLAVISTDFGHAFGAAPVGERLARMEASPQHGKDAFVNPAPVAVMREGGFSLLQEWLSGTGRTPSQPLPTSNIAPQRFLHAPESGLRVTWLGHSTVLVEIDGVRLLTDPIWSARASPSTLVGPKRFHPPPISIHDVGPLDAVLISHDHYDHLDMATIRDLTAEVPLFLVPLGVGAHLEAWGVPAVKIREHDWGDETALRRMRIVATPAQHFSGRGFWDRNRTLWTSWTMIGPNHRVFFSGDTGLAPQFPAIGERYGPFDLVMLEIGAFHPSWGDIHLGPQQALTAWEQLGGGLFLPIHWSTFELALHPWQEPVETLQDEARRRGVPLALPVLGEPFEPGAQVPTAPWWANLATVVPGAPGHQTSSPQPE